MKLFRFFLFVIIMMLYSILSLAESSKGEVPSNDDITEMGLSEIFELKILRGNALQTHVHRKGEFMFRYMYMLMGMENLYSGSKKVSEDEALGEFMVTPLNMDTSRHMFMPMYGITNKLSVMAMINYFEKTMKHKTRMGMEFETETKGLGDTEIIFDYAVLGVNVSSDDENIKLDKQRIIISGGWTLPTGSINERGDTPAGSNLVLPFPMQLGSGTVDLFLGATYLYDFDGVSLSAEFLGRFPLGRNDQNYSVGNIYIFWLDADYKISEASSISALFKVSSWEDYDGFDSRVNPSAMPTIATKRPDLRAGERLDLGIRYNYFLATDSTKEKGARFFGEITAPIHQRLDSYNLGMSWMLHFGGSYTF